MLVVRGGGGGAPLFVMYIPAQGARRARPSGWTLRVTRRRGGGGAAPYRD